MKSERTAHGSADPRPSDARFDPVTGHEVGDVLHDAGQFEILGGINGGNAQFAQFGPVVLWDDPADDDRRLDSRSTELVEHLGNKLEVAAGQDRDSDDLATLAATRPRRLPLAQPPP